MSNEELGWLVQDWTPPRAPDATILTGHWVQLERLTPAHASDLHAANQVSDRIWDYLPYGPFDLAGQIDWVNTMAGKSDPYFFALRDLSSQKVVGVASYLRIDPAAGSIEVGHINFAPVLQRTPAATEAMFLMMDWAFAAGYRRYEWKCNALNIPSRRAAERLGLSFEGIFRQAGIVKGRNRDTAWFAAINAEWPKLRSAFVQWLSAGNFGADGQQKQSLSTLTAPILVTRDPALI